MMQKVDFSRPVSEIVHSYAVDSRAKAPHDEKSMIDAIKSIQESRLLPSEVEKRNTAFRYAANEWFSQRMRNKYQELLPELFDVEREVSCKPEKVLDRHGEPTSYSGEFRLKIPVLLSAEMGKDQGWKKEVSVGNGYSSNEYNVTLFSRMPFVPADVREAGKQAVAFAYKTFAEALTTEEIGDIITSNPEYMPNPSSSKLMVMWKPKPSEIHVQATVVERDPALVLKCEKPYLVKTWSVPEEEPFMSIINACKKPNLSNFMPK
jgi:hypothetical protein